MDKPIKIKGFTLIELLVVVMLVIVLAGITFAITGNIKQRAGAVKRTSDVRQAGIILLSKASETNNRCEYFSSGSGSFELRPYYIVKTGVGLAIFDSLETEIMSWDGKKLPPKLPA